MWTVLRALTQSLCRTKSQSRTHTRRVLEEVRGTRRSTTEVTGPEVYLLTYTVKDIDKDRLLSVDTSVLRVGFP